MTTSDLSSGVAYLRDSAKDYFENLYGISNIQVNSELHRDLTWVPSLRFIVNGYQHVFVEVSESSPYPSIFGLRYADVLQYPEPISIYCVCPEEVALEKSSQGDIRKLELHGFGLVTVDSSGGAHRKVSAIPIVQLISDREYRENQTGMTQKMKQRVAQAFEDYNNKPSTGVATLTETVEGQAQYAAKQAAGKGWIKKSDANGSIAKALDAMYEAKPCIPARSAIGGMRSHIAQHRNVSHHWPKNKKKARQKYVDCRYAFIDGMKQMNIFRAAMKNIGLKGTLPGGS